MAAALLLKLNAAVAAVIPAGNTTGGHAFKHLAVHAVLLGFNV